MNEMKILEPNTGTEKEVVLVEKRHVYIYVTDYKRKLFLKEIKISPGQHHWIWIDPQFTTPIDLADVGVRYSTFDHALNRAINDAYCTVYVFESWEEAVQHWNEISYVDNISTVYESNSAEVQFTNPIQNERCIISEFHVVEVCFKDQGILVKSLKEMGYKPVVYDEAVNLHGYQGDKRVQKAHVVIPKSQVGSASNDVGFEKTNKGFILHASAYDHAWRTGEKLKTLNKTYVKNVVKNYANSTCDCSILSCNEREDGKTEIQLRVFNQKGLEG